LVFPMNGSHIARCPSCDTESVKAFQTEYEVEHFGTVLLSVATCQRCGYKHSDVMTLTGRKPTVLSVCVNSLEDLKIPVIKSGTASIIIPDFGVTIAPGPYSESYTSNVEGILQRVEGAVTFLLNSAKGKNLKKAERMLKKIRVARETKPHFTLMINDPFGNSALVSPDPNRIGKRKLMRRELLAVKFGRYALTQKAPP
jgi:zinc finger protein